MPYDVAYFAPLKKQVGFTIKRVKLMLKQMRAHIKKSGSFHGKSNALGHGGRAAQLKAEGVPGGVIGKLARKAQAAPGQKNYHGKRKGK